MSLRCVNINNPEFKKLQEELDIHTDQLKSTIGAWQTDNNTDEYPPVQYLKDRFGLGDRKSPSPFTIERLVEYDKAHRLWEDSYKTPAIFEDLSTALEYFRNAEEAYGSDVKMVRTRDGNYRVSVDEPTIKDVSDSVIEETFDVKPEQGKKVKGSGLKEQVSNLTEDQKVEYNALPDSPKESLREDKPIEISYENLERLNLYNNEVLLPEDREHLSKQAINLFSNILDQLQTIPEASQNYFGNRYSVDFTKMTRSDILRTVTPYGIFNVIKEQLFNPRNRADLPMSSRRKLKVAYDNFYSLIDSSYYKLISMEHITLGNNYFSEQVNNAESDEEVNSADTAGLEQKGRESWQLGFRNVSIKESLSPLIRRVFEKLDALDSNFKPYNDEFGFREKVNPEVAYNTVLKTVRPALNINEMINLLKGIRVNQPWVDGLLRQLEDEPLRSQFFQNFRKDFTTYSVVVRNLNSNGTYTYRTKIINTQGAEQAILDEVRDLYQDGTIKLIENPDVDGAGKVNTKLLSELKATTDNLLSDLRKKASASIITKASLDSYVDDNIDSISNVLKAIGINADTNMLKVALTSIPNLATDINVNASNAQRILSAVSTIFDVIEKNANAESYNPYSSKDNVKSQYRSISRILSPFLEDYVESSVFENDKLYYAFTTPSYLGKLMLKLKDSMKNPQQARDFLEQNYTKFEWFAHTNSDGSRIYYNKWLQQLAENPEAKEVLDHKVQLHFNKVGYTDMSRLDYTVALMMEYFSDPSGKTAWYHVPILADKPSGEYIKFYRYTDKNTTGGYKNAISNHLNSVAKQELKRIRTVIERSKKKGIKKITNFDDLKIGGRFQFMDMLNPLLDDSKTPGYELVQRYINGGTLSQEEAYSLSNIMRDMISESMELRYQQAIRAWQNAGVLDYTLDAAGNRTYTYLSQLERKESGLSSLERARGIFENLENYFWNSYFATSQIIQLTVTDLAYYKDAEDFQKRFAQTHSPALRFNIYAVDSNGNRYSDGIERTIYVADDIEVSSIKDNVAKIFDDKIANSAPSDRADLKKMRDLIVSQFDEINVADAQGYTSITGYRKKMGMSGKWTPQMEEAYNRLKKGNWNLSDLNVVWQPLKPFVYTQVSKDSYVSTMTELKVPVQNKNSEYLLLMTDALMRGAGQNNTKLAAIHDFMEDYNIDTIQFESAVKSGKQGVINLNEGNSYVEVVEELEKALLSNDVKGYTYNPQIVHEISFEDYGIQQEVPEHLVDVRQFFGSQIRKLILADIDPATTFTVNGKTYSKNEIIERYEGIIATNVKESFDNLVKELGLDNENIKAQNAKISELLVEEIKKNARYGPELLRACSLNEEGDFVVPLCDPTNSVRVQQLLNSIIKDRVTKQRIKGGAVVQVSNFGLSGDLKIKFKKDGSVEYFECYMPAYSRQFFAPLMDENGKLDINKRNAEGELILPEELRKFIGYRIPTEDKYSMNPLYIKGFLPQEAGSAIMLPKEITLLAGSDFDIDKIYIMLPEFTTIPRVNKEKMKRDMLKSFEGKFSERKKRKEALDIVFNEIENGTIQFSKGSFEQAVYDWYQAHKEEYVIKGSVDRFVKVKYDDSLGDQNPLEARNNEVMDIMWSILTNKDAAEKMFNPGSFNVQKKAARIITLLKNTDKYSYSQLSNMRLKQLNKLIEESGLIAKKSLLDPVTQVDFHQQNTIAGKLIGAFANHNSSHAVLQLQNVRFELGKHPMVFDGISFDKKRGKIDDVYALDGTTYISKTIAGFLAASVDAVKDPVLNFLNLNTYTANPAMTLIRLGYDTDSVGLLLTQPAIEATTREYFKRSNEGYIDPKSVVSDMIDEIISDQFGNRITEEDVRRDLPNITFTKEELARSISTKNRDEKFYRDQLNALVFFKDLLGMASNLNELTFITKFDTVANAAGPTIADTTVVINRVNRFFEKMMGYFPPFSESALQVFEKNPMISAFYEYGVLETSRVFREYFPFYDSTFARVVDTIENMVKSKLNSKIVNKIYNEYIAYKMTNPANGNPVFRGSQRARELYIRTFPERYKEKISDPKLRDNALIKLISIKPADKKCPVPTLEARTGGLSTESIERVKNAWSNMMKDEDTKGLALGLFYYNFYRNGFTFGPNAFMHLVPIDVKQEALGYISSLRRDSDNSIFSPEDEMAEKFFIDQFFRNNWYKRRLVPLIRAKDITIIQEADTYVIEPMPGSSEFYKLILRNTTGGNEYVPYFLTTITEDGQDTEILLGLSRDNVSPIYTKVSKLGNRNNFLEYEYNTVPVSVLPQSGKLVNEETRESDPEAVDPNEMGTSQTLTEDQKNEVINQQVESIVKSVENLTPTEIEALGLSSNKSKDEKIKAIVESLSISDPDIRRSIEDALNSRDLRDKNGDKIC